MKLLNEQDSMMPVLYLVLQLSSFHQLWSNIDAIQSKNLCNILGNTIFPGVALKLFPIPQVVFAHRCGF